MKRVFSGLFPALMGMGARGLSDLTDPGKAAPRIVTNLMHPVVLWLESRKLSFAY